MHQTPFQPPAYQLFGELCGINEALELNTCFDTHLVAHEDEVLGADIAGGAARGVTAEGAPSQTRH